MTFYARGIQALSLVLTEYISGECTIICKRDSRTDHKTKCLAQCGMFTAEFDEDGDFIKLDLHQNLNSVEEGEFVIPVGCLNGDLCLDYSHLDDDRFSFAPSFSVKKSKDWILIQFSVKTENQVWFQNAANMYFSIQDGDLAALVISI